MIASVVLTTLLARQASDTWDIKTSYTTGKKIAWTTSVNATVSGATHDASFTMSFTPGDTVGTDGARKALIEWHDVEMDGSSVDLPVSYTLTVGLDGIVRDKTGDDGDDVRRWASVFSFPYPAKPVAVGDKWTAEITPTVKGLAKLTYTCEAKEVTKVGDKEALRVTSTETEAGSDGIKNDASWFIGRDGSILKFKLDVKNWVVPFAGPGLVEATINGTIK